MDNDIIDISLDFENLDGGSSWNNQKKTNFGGGIELLMNEKKWIIPDLLAILI